MAAGSEGSSGASAASALPPPPWVQHPELLPVGAVWRGEARSERARWRAGYEALSPDAQEAYRRAHPAPLYWFWFYEPASLGGALMVVATFPLWLLVWALVRAMRR